MIQIIQQTKEQKLEMYMKMKKRELAEMLINCNLFLEDASKQSQQYSASSAVCLHEFVSREYSSQAYGTCMICGKTVFE